MRVLGEWSQPGWLLRLAIAEPSDAGTRVRLSAGEQQRAARFVRAEDRAAYVAAHLVARDCAASVAGCEAAELGEWRQECATCAGARGRLHGRPGFAGRSELGISLAHSGSWVAALAGPPGVGVDLEVFGRGAGAPRRLLPADEVRWLERHDGERDLLRLWCRKEALFKAGVGTEPAGIAVLDEQEPATRLAGHRLLEPDWRDGVLVAALPVGSPEAE
ncbi:4'-phosphopantetheinyl transferase superfamily protein [Nocardioides dubius]|uniref:4'-phosphopantetheinyl transferase domain-containing protein n=1 Tax=Nocardioides dubius TaxID=317019 RepID=A0ABN1TML5_9ACTN